mgnify:CR=1 FL=1
MMNTRKSITLIAFLGWMLAASGTFAQRPNSSARAERAEKIQEFYKNIPNLTEDQEKKIKEMRQNHFKEMGEIREEWRAASSEAGKKEIRDMMVQKMRNHRNDIRGLLTEEQKKYFDENFPGRQNRPADRNRGGRSRPGNRGDRPQDGGRGQRQF